MSIQLSVMIFIFLFFSNSLRAQEDLNQQQSKSESPISKPISPFQFTLNEKIALVENSRITYHLQNESMQVGRINIQKNDFKIAFIKADNLQNNNGSNNSTNQNMEKIVIELIQAEIDFHSLEILDRTGQLIFQSKIGQSNISIYDPKTSMNMILSQSNSFRICFISKFETDELRICSSNLTFDDSIQDFRFLQPTEQAKNRIYINNNEVANHQSSFVPEQTEKLTIHFENKAGMSLSYVGQIPQLNITELTRSKDQVNISGKGLLPLEIQLNKLENDLHPMISQTYTPHFYFEDPDNWFGSFQFQDKITFHFQNGVYSPFEIKVQLFDLPLEKDKPTIQHNHPNVTYLNQTHREIILSDNTKISSLIENLSTNTSNQAKIELRQNSIFDITANTMQITDSKNQSRLLKYESILGTNTEVSVRLTSATGGNNATFLGEFKSDYWFETIPFMKTHQYSLLRLGVSAKYYQNISEMSYIQKNNETETEIKTKMRLFYLDLKYRTNPGIWNRDESVGPILSFQQADVTNTQFNLIGLGFFWARSMPFIFNEIMNYLPYMKYPKYVDLDFVYYFNTPSKDFRLISNWALNFHGKVMWTKQFFGEAGFGFKTYSIYNSSNNIVALSSFYGTVGIGWQF